MAISAIGGGDLALLRGEKHLSFPKLNIVNPSTVATLTVSSAPTLYPYVEISVTGSMTNVEIGHRIKIESSGGTIKSWGIVRKAPSGSTLFVNPIYAGDSGYPELIETAIVSGDTITVYDDFPLWGLFSTIQGGSFFKQWDVAYTDQNAQPPPIANAGTCQADTVTSGSATFSLPASGSNTSFAFGSATISSYTWTLPAGVTVATGSTSDASFTVNATPGQHKIKLVVTDSNSKTHTAYTWLFVDDGSTYTSTGETYNFQVTSDSEDLTGRRMSVTLTGNDLETIFPQALACFTETATYNGSSLTGGVLVDTFVGYVQSIQYGYQDGVKTAVCEIVSPVIATQNINTPSQLITEKTTPQNWTQVTSDLSNPRGALCYVRWQCPSLFSNHDVVGNITTPRKKSYEYNGNTIQAHLRVASQTIIGNVGSASDGTTVLVQNPNYEDNTFRNALATVFTIQPQDIVGSLENTRNFFMATGETRGGAFAYNGSKSKAWAGIRRWGQGTGKESVSDFSVDMTGGLDRVKEVVGHHHALVNNPYQFRIQLNRNMDVLSPAYMKWVGNNISDTYDARNEGFTNARYLCLRVDRQWDIENGTKAVTVLLQPETFGQPSEQLIIGNAGGGLDFGGWSWTLPVPYQPALEDLPDIALLTNTSGQLAITQNLQETNPNYFDLTEFVTGDVADMAWDYGSAYFTSGRLLDEPLSAYVVSQSGSTAYIYRLYDVKASVFEFVQLTSYALNDSSNEDNARISTNRLDPDYVVFAVHDQTGTETGISTDGGGTWGSLTNAGSTISDTDNDDAVLGLTTDDNVVIVSAPDGSGNYEPYIATGSGSFSAVGGTGSTQSTIPNPLMQHDEQGNLYVGLLGTGAGAEYEVTFDAGGHSTYTVHAGSSETATGNPGDAVENDDTGTTGDTRTTLLASVIITLPSKKTITHIELDAYWGVNWKANAGAATTLNLQTSVELLDGVTQQDFETLIHETDTAPADTAFSFTLDHAWQTVTHTYSPNISDVDTIELDVVVATSGAVTFAQFNSAGSLRIDNIKIFTTSGGGGSDPQFFRVDDYAGSPVWTDITPPTDRSPEQAYGAFTDILDPDFIEVFAASSSNTKWFESSDNGDTWTDNGTADYRFGKRVGELGLLAGDSAFDVEYSGGVTDSKLGDLATVWGSVGIIENVLILKG